VPRLTAFRVLRSGTPTPMRQLEAAAEHAGLDPRDRGLARKLVGTEVRHRGTLRAILRHFLRGKPSADFLAHMHLGLVQLIYLDRVPPHAAVNQTVGLVRDTVGQAKVKQANAILRGAQRMLCEGTTGDPRRDIVGRELHLAEPLFRDPDEHPLLWAEDALSMPAQLLKRWSARLGWERARELALQALREPPLSVRAVGVSGAELAAELTDKGLSPRPGLHPDVLLFAADETEALLASAAFAVGRATVQGETALRAAEAVAAREGERVLDLCAAPGGKTAVLAASGARVTAADVSPEKLALVESTLARQGLEGAVERIVNTPGALDPVRTEPFDAVLVDAPCTNTGVLAARPEARWRFGPKTKQELVALQADLLRQGAALVRPGGRLVWSTCALEPDENRRQLDALVAEQPDFRLETDAETLPDTATTQTEGAGPIDGGYFARLVRG
jgi:16S rRNA (cytosine967-C5)-methyltransferase